MSGYRGLREERQWADKLAEKINQLFAAMYPMSIKHLSSSDFRTEAENTHDKFIGCKYEVCRGGQTRLLITQVSRQ